MAVPAEDTERATTALRYVMWWADCQDWVAAGGCPGDAPPCPVRDEDLPALAGSLAGLAYSARRALAGQQGVAPAEQHDVVYGWMQSEIEILEVNAAFAAVEAEVGAQG